MVGNWSNLVLGLAQMVHSQQTFEYWADQAADDKKPPHDVFYAAQAMRTWAGWGLRIGERWDFEMRSGGNLPEDRWRNHTSR